MERPLTSGLGMSGLGAASSPSSSSPIHIVTCGYHSGLADFLAFCYSPASKAGWCAEAAMEMEEEAEHDGRHREGLTNLRTVV